MEAAMVAVVMAAAKAVEVRAGATAAVGREEAVRVAVVTAAVKVGCQSLRRHSNARQSAQCHHGMR